MTAPDGAVRHAEVRIGDSMLMLTDGGGEWKPMPASLYLYVNDADATYKRALAAGATSVMEPVAQFYGDRQGGVKIRRETSGGLPHTSRMCLPRSCGNGPRAASASSSRRDNRRAPS